MRSTAWLMLIGLGAMLWALEPNLASAADDKGVEVEIDGLKSRAPAAWKKVDPTSRFQTYRFQLPKVGEDKEDAVMLVIYLDGQGGGVDDNIKRWKGMVTPPDGKGIDDVSKVEKLKIGDVTATYLDVQGTYKPPPFEKAPPIPNARLLAVYWDSKKGPYFLRMIGPAKTVEHYKKGMEDWMKSFK